MEVGISQSGNENPRGPLNPVGPGSQVAGRAYRHHPTLIEQDGFGLGAVSKSDLIGNQESHLPKCARFLGAELIDRSPSAQDDQDLARNSWNSISPVSSTYNTRKDEGLSIP